MASKIMKLSLSIAFAFIAILFIQTAVNSTHAIGQQQNSRITTLTKSALLDEEVFKQADKSLVTITRTLPSPTMVTPQTQNITVLGSGFLYDNQGHIITNNHVVGNAKMVNVLFENGDRRTAKVVGGDMLNDIAVLKIVENLTQHAQQQTPPLHTTNDWKFI
ncbi:MAG: trypsin-like peptidase domain-containing protein [Candidatus Nitrosopolaris sp.]|jgi:S1-C subfamily serine protease